MKKKSLYLIPIILGMLLTACGGGGPSSGGGDNPGGDTPGGDPTEQIFSDAKFESLEFTYDGTPHILGEVTGVPEGTKITYTGLESHIDAGTYGADAKLEKEGYKTKNLHADLFIMRANFPTHSFENVTVTYDGQDHFNDIKFVCADLPAGSSQSLTVTSSGQTVTKAIDAGAYQYKLQVTNKNYETLNLTAILTINETTFSGYTYDSVTVKYDGNDHYNDVQLVGVFPEGTTRIQTVKNSEGTTVTTAIEPGTYNYEMVVDHKNYERMVLKTTLKITVDKSVMPVFTTSGGSIYFANGLDNKYAYAYYSDGTLKRVDTSSPKEFNKYDRDTATYIANSMFVDSVKQVNSTSLEVLFTESNIDDFVKYSDNVYYYASNPLFNSEKAGIYKVVDNNDSGNEPTITRVFSGKTDNLYINSGYLYFINKSDNNKVYRLNISNNTSSKFLDQKVHEFVVDNSKLYCTVNGSLNDYIGYVSTSGSSYGDVTKLTDASGEYLTINSGYLYYNYTDLYSIVEPENKGIWRINLNGGQATQIVKTENINGFDVKNSTSLAYIDSADLHLYLYDITNNTKTDLLKNFVPAENTPLNTGGKTINHNGSIYYLNMYAGKTLYVYEESSNMNYQLTTNKVQDFYIIGEKLYFNQVTMLTNNDLYVADLTMNGDIEKINSNDLRNMVTDGTYIYGTHYNWAGAASGIARMKLDGSNYLKFSTVSGAKNFQIKDGKLYYINCSNAQDNGYIEYINMSDITDTSTGLGGTRLSNNIKNVKQFIIEGNNIFYAYNGTIDNSIRRTDFTSLGEGTKIASEKTNPSEFLLEGDYIYYYSYASTASSYAGFYKVNKNATQDNTYYKIAGYDNKYYGTALAKSGNNIYFLNYIPKLLLGDAHFYQLNTSSQEIKKIS